MPMLHDEAQRKKDEDAVASGHCPECGQDLAEKDVRNHLQMEFPRWQEPEQANSDYRRRALLLDALATHREETSKKGSSN